MDLLTQVENEKIQFNSQRDSSDLKMQGENYAICHDLGGFGYTKIIDQIVISTKTESYIQSRVFREHFLRSKAKYLRG